VPPPGVTVAEPLLPPKQETLVVAEIVAVTCVGCVIFAVVVRVHPFASVTVTVYVPLANPDTVAPVPPDGAQVYVYPPTPPPGVTVAEPLLPPKQETFVVAEIVAVTCVGCVIVAVVVTEHPFASVTVTV
jgi:hypothetical protein